jgi:WD40 repeat protein
MNVLALSADDRLFATATGLSCQIEIWSSEDGKRLHVLGEASKQPKTVGSPCVKAVAFSPDGTRAAALIEPAGSSLVLSIWNIADEKLIGNPVVVAAEGDYAALKFEPDGKTVSVVYCGLVTFWNPEAGTPPRVVRAPEPIMPMPDKPNGIIVDVFVTRFGGAIFAGATALAPDGEKAASLTQDGSIAIWSIETLKVVQTLPSVEATRRSETFGGELVALRYSPNGRRLAGVTHVGEIVFWEVP